MGLINRRLKVMNLLFALIILISLLRTEQSLLGNVMEAYHSVGCRIDQVKCYNSDVCISVTRICDNIRDCIDNSDEIDCHRRHPSTTMKPTGKPLTLNCTFSFTRCYDNSRCIPILWICDGGVPDCSDKSDEIDCYRRSSTSSIRTSTPSSSHQRRSTTTERTFPMELINCSSGQMMCLDNSGCISVTRICDNIQDCADNSDERYCYCGRGQLMCLDGSRCIPVTSICNNHPDCNDNSDEKYCSQASSTMTRTSAQISSTMTRTTTAQPMNCTSDETSCYDGSRCVPLRWICDGDRDCVDNSDEIDCYRRFSTSFSSSTPIQFTTPINIPISCSFGYTNCYDNSKCVPLSWICDNFKDCGDNSDEIDCYRRLNTTSTSTTTTTRNLTCDPGYTNCYDNSRCISVNWICDRDKDCNDNSDEIDCYRRPTTTSTSTSTTTTQILTCSSDETSCYDGSRCVPLRWICDGYQDCDDNSDEIDCSECSAGQVKCSTSDVCIPAYWVCDGIGDCRDSSDEANCSASDRQPATTPELRPSTNNHIQNHKDQESTIERHVSDHNTSKPPRIPQSKETLFNRDFTDKSTSINPRQLTTPESQALTQEEATGP